MLDQSFCTDADMQVQRLVEKRFDKKITFFYPIQQPTSQFDGYWHIRLKGGDETIFVRQNGAGELLVYGPVKPELLEPESF